MFAAKTATWKKEWGNKTTTHKFGVGHKTVPEAAKEADFINSATEFKLRCERRLGEMLASMEKHQGGRPTVKPVNGVGQVSTLDEMGIDRNLSARAKRIAAVPEEKFEAAAQ